MIKVLQCISDTNFGGAGRVLLNYLKYFNSDEFDMTVVVPKGSKLLSYMSSERYRIIEFDGLYDRSYDRNDVKNLIRLIRKINPDIVHSHGALSARIAGRRCHKKVVYTRHSVFDLPKWQTTFPGKLFLGMLNNHYADRIIAVSPAAKDLLVSSGTKEKIIDVIFNGVEKVLPAEIGLCNQLRTKYGIESKDFVCTILARLEQVKGHKYLIKAAKLLKEQGIENFKILIAGTGEAEQELKDLSKKLQVEDMVIFLGFVTDIPTLLSITNIQINASYGTEATSMALLEGFSMGIPAVVSDFGGNPFVVHNEYNGLVYPKKDELALSKAIQRLMSDSELLSQCSAGAIELFERKFTAENMSKETEGVYKTIMGEV